MHARQDAEPQHADDVWARLSAPLPAGAIAWRQDGKPIARGGRHVARFVAYIEAHTVRERLDIVVPGDWNLTLDLLPSAEPRDDATDAQPHAFKARLQVLGVVREDVGTGKDYKQASTDAFKRVAVRFGIGNELYALGPNWVAMDGEGKYAKPTEDPQRAYERRHAHTNGVASATHDGAVDTISIVRAAPAADLPPCPKCGGVVWDNRIGKRNPKAPDFKCKNKPRERGGPGCEGVIWPPRDGTASPYAAAAPRRAGGGEYSAPHADDTTFRDSPPPFDDAPPHDDDDLPF